LSCFLNTAFSQVDVPIVAQQALGFVGKVPETFQSSIVPTGGLIAIQILRDVDSEAKVLNNVAALM
jgi:filamentous hemagglutinin